jgi:K+-sensing histidine kinase KdpD
MRIVQDNTYNLGDNPFFQSKQSYNPSLDKYVLFAQNINDFLKQLSSIDDVGSIINHFILSLKKYFNVFDANIFLVNEAADELIPLIRSRSMLIEKMILAEKTGVFEWIFENNKHAIIPENKLINDEKNNNIMCFIPIVENKKKRGVFVLITDVSENDFSSIYVNIINTYLFLSMQKIDKQILKEKLNTTINNLQVYQAKLANDSKYSAIGEMAEGFVEDILTPLQNIVSYVDMMFPNTNNQGAQFIKNQVSKIQDVIKRLIKFTNLNEVKNEYQPCDVNYHIKQFFNLIKTTLDNLRIECVLDLDNNLPSILSNPNYLSQILSNIFALIRSTIETTHESSGGMIIQTRALLDFVFLEIITTYNIQNYLYEMKRYENNAPFLNLKIIENLIEKHEGEFKLETTINSGTKFIIKFPINRKMK